MEHRTGCSEPCPTWPGAFPGMGHPQLLMATLGKGIPILTENMKNDACHFRLCAKSREANTGDAAEKRESDLAAVCHSMAGRCLSPCLPWNVLAVLSHCLLNLLLIPVHRWKMIALISVVCGSQLCFRQTPVAFVSFHFGYLLVFACGIFIFISTDEMCCLEGSLGSFPFPPPHLTFYCCFLCPMKFDIQGHPVVCVNLLSLSPEYPNSTTVCISNFLQPGL